MARRGDGIATAITPAGAFGSSEEDGNSNTTLSNIAKKFYIKAGRSLLRIAGGLIQSSKTGSSLGSCNSLIQLIIDTPEFKILELLHAQVPPKNGPGIVQRYSMGGDIIHLFTKGNVLFNRTVDRQFESIPVEISGKESGCLHRLSSLANFIR